MQKELSEALIEKFALLLDHHAPQQLSSGLRDILLEYLAVNIPNGFPIHTQELLWAINSLFDLLDSAAEELQASQNGGNIIGGSQPSEAVLEDRFSLWENT